MQTCRSLMNAYYSGLDVFPVGLYAKITGYYMNLLLVELLGAHLVILAKKRSMRP